MSSSAAAAASPHSQQEQQETMTAKRSSPARRDDEMDANDAGPLIAEEGSGGGISVKAQTQKGAMPFGSAGQGGPLFVARMCVLV